MYFHRPAETALRETLGSVVNYLDSGRLEEDLPCLWETKEGDFLIGKRRKMDCDMPGSQSFASILPRGVRLQVLIGGCYIRAE